MFIYYVIYIIISYIVYIIIIYLFHSYHYTCIHTHTCIYTYTHMYIHIHIYVYTLCTHIHAHIHIRICYARYAHIAYLAHIHITMPGYRSPLLRVPVAGYRGEACAMRCPTPCHTDPWHHAQRPWSCHTRAPC